MNPVLKEIVYEAIKSVDPEKILKNRIRIQENKILFDSLEIEFRNIFLVAVGKASIKMVRAVENFPFKDSIVVTNVNEKSVFRTIKAGHPVPDENSILSAKIVHEIIKKAGEGDLILFMLSGGASALLGDFLIPKERMMSLTGDLINGGANIFELNAVRKHLSFLKGGKMVKETRAKILSLIISDVMHDDLSTIGSGPTYFDEYTFSDAMQVLKKFNLDEKYKDIMDMLANPEKYNMKETLKKDEFPSERVWNIIVCNNSTALNSAERKAREMGFRVKNLGTTIEGEAREVSKNIYREFEKMDNGSVLVSGGETVVHVKGNGKGGRNQELVLSLFDHIKDNEIIASFGTDGIDGPTDAAGAFLDKNIIERARKMNLDPKAYLDNNDSYNFFKKTDGLIITGPTGTNVMDVQIFIKL